MTRPTTEPSLLARCCGRHWGNSNYKEEACEEHLYIKDRYCNSDISIKYIWRTTRAVSWWSFRISNESGTCYDCFRKRCNRLPSFPCVILEMKLLFVVRFQSKELKWPATGEMEDFLNLFLLSVFNLSLLFNVYSFILCILILIIYSLICFGIYFYVFCTYYWISFSHWQNNFHLEFWNKYSVWIRLKRIWN